MAEPVDELLCVDSVTTGYRGRQVLNSVSLNIRPGEIVAVIGHNGAGKSTLLKAIFGLLPLWNGQVRLDGIACEQWSPRERLDRGIAYVPQGNRVFEDLTVQENLEIGLMNSPKKQTLRDQIERVVLLFPDLESKLRQYAATLSGGERQMLALAGVLISSPRLLLIDEPSLGLAPLLARRCLSRLSEISRDHHTACLIVEQKVREVLNIANRAYVIKTGSVSFSGDAKELLVEATLRSAYL